MKSLNCPPRLAVVAAIIDGEGLGRGPVAKAARLGTEIREKAQSAAAATATPAERALAQAMRGDGQRDEHSADHAIAELLLLVDDGPEASKLATGLSQAFLRPGGFNAALARDERRSAFADLYRSLALHQLNSQVRNKAAALMCGLIRRRPGTRKGHDGPPTPRATGDPGSGGGSSPMVLFAWNQHAEFSRAAPRT